MLTRLRELFRKRKWLTRLIIFLIGWVVVHSLIITMDGLRDTSASSGVAIVLGNRVYADGSLASWTKGRVDKALQLYRQGKVKLIFVSGGQSTVNDYPEGKAMKAYLLGKGVPDSAIIEDNKGANTYLTALDFLKWNENRHYNSVIIVSQFYHITRSKYILKKLGYGGTVYSASSDVFGWIDIIGTLREVPAFYKYLLFY